METRSLVSRSQFSRQTLPTTICCVCGVLIVANSVNTCARCLQSRHDITYDLEKQIVIIQCKRCDKWQKEDATWTKANTESKELLAFCLRRVKNLRALRLIDASFAWTEPHSKRIKVKIKVQKEVEKGVVLQQSCVIEFVVQNRMCADCHRSEASLTWDSVVQLRQNVPHKRTFLYLEQVILKNNAQERAIKIEPQPEGVDFFFVTKQDGARFLSFLEATVPVRSKQSEKLISADLKSNNSTYNYTFSVEIAPICKDDLVVLPPAAAAHLGSMPRLCLCLHVASVIRLIDPFTTRFCEISTGAYWQHPFKPIVDASRLTVFVVLDVMQIDDGAVDQQQPRTRGQTFEDEGEAEEEEDGQGGSQEGGDAQDGRRERKRRRKSTVKKHSTSARLSGKHALCEVEVAKEKDFGVNDERHFVRCHLGFVLKPGDHALGYDLRTCNFNFQDEQPGTKPVEFPDIVLVRKHYPRVTKYERKWKLKSIVAEAPDRPGYGMGVHDEDGPGARDMEIFMRDLEEDKEMRDKVNLYVNKKAVKKKSAGSGAKTAADWPPEVPLEELLSDMHLGDSKSDAGEAAMQGEGEEEGEEEEEDASL
jgi:nonsense-mediated mRNA decay protein 3